LVVFLQKNNKILLFLKKKKQKDFMFGAAGRCMSIDGDRVAPSGNAGRAKSFRFCFSETFNIG
jgi:hypothetical protein